MTGFINPGTNPFSRLTVAALKDMGYEINFDAANTYALPSHLQLSMMGVWAETHYYRCCASGLTRRGREPVVLPEEAEVSSSGRKRGEGRPARRTRSSRKQSAVDA
jgi:hypothetical protein